MTVLPPSPKMCMECATEHFSEEPHFKDSLYYQMNFYNTRGHYPTWNDAMAHCLPEIQALWRDALRKKGVNVPDVEVNA